jgi:RNA-splicing ligase RtcB
MATGTYIVEGLGNTRSFESASHGAGRRMSRGVARKTVTEDELRAAMAGKAWNENEAKTLLDEAPAAYKPIEEVMDAQSDLVRVVHTLRQVLNYKGT